ncbi:MAG: hypothetical protein E7420_01930 [Ruminococcaceae bacterium]|nr:hypothetical protein [Oscillospiraceae bacterium]
MQQIPIWYLDSMQHEGNFITNKALELKVDSVGRLKRFSGETVVFLLPDYLKDALEKIQRELFAVAGEMLSCNALSKGSLHMTLHDLWNESDAGKHSFPPYTHDDICKVIEGIRRDYPQKIMMRAIAAMNMVNSSVVMGLLPATDADAWALADMYGRLDALYPLNYGLTPHITLSYYKPGEYSEEVWRGLQRVFTMKGWSFPLYTKDLVFQRFSDMESYETIY